jgi:hypothetical protein
VSRGPGFLALGCVVFLAPSAAHAWGNKGHAMSARVAAHALPPEVPAFLREADLELGYLCPEPDRWRSEAREPALRGATDRDHGFRVEDVTFPLPPQRYLYFQKMLATPRPGGGTYTYQDIGFAPYSIAELAERLTNGFMRWRNARAGTPAGNRIKRQIEADVVYTAGLLGHFITDTAQPLHTTIHVNGWNPRVPNPRGFVGQDIHGRFETTYVNAVLEEADFQKLVGPVRVVGPWLQAALAHIVATHAHVEEVYALDQAHPFGSGAEGAAARRFTAERLAAGAQALRDFWYTAWVRSGPLAEEAARNAPPDPEVYDPYRSGSRRSSR